MMKMHFDRFVAFRSMYFSALLISEKQKFPLLKSHFPFFPVPRSFRTWPVQSENRAERISNYGWRVERISGAQDRKKSRNQFISINFSKFFLEVSLFFLEVSVSESESTESKVNND